MLRAEPCASALSGSTHSTVGDGAGSCAAAGTARQIAAATAAAPPVLLMAPPPIGTLAASSAAAVRASTRAERQRRACRGRDGGAAAIRRAPSVELRTYRGPNSTLGAFGAIVPASLQAEVRPAGG